MKISIVTPSWNQGRFFRRCLESIHTVPGVALEHIVLDNCSNDETPGLLAEFAARQDGVERRFIVEKDEGQTRAINDGFRMATGDVLCWLNTDEYYHDGTLETVANFLQLNPQVDVVYGDCDFVDADNRLVKRRRSFDFSASMLLYYGCYISSCATFLRRRIIDAGEFLDPDFRVAMDYEYYTRLAAHGYAFDHISKPLASFTWHEANISRQQKQRSREERSRIQATYSGIPGPDPLRRPIFDALAICWRGVRGLKRISGQT